MDKIANKLGFDSKQPIYDGDIYQELYHLKSLSNNYISLVPYEIIDYMIDKYMYNNTHKIIFDTHFKEEFLSSIKKNNLLYLISYKTFIFDNDNDDDEYKNMEILISKLPTQHNKYKLLHFNCDGQIPIYDNPDDYIDEQKIDKNLELNDVSHIVISVSLFDIIIDFKLNNENNIINISSPLELNIYLTNYYPICKTRQERLLNKK